MRINDIVRAAMVGVLAIGLAACSPPAPKSDGSAAPSAGATDTGGGGKGGKQKIVVWGWLQTDGWKKLTEAYTEKHPEVTIEYRGFKSDEYNKILQTGLSGSSGPDVMMLRSYGGLETLAASGVLAPVDGVKGLSDFAEPMKAGATARKDGKLYGVPFAVQTANIMYNKKLFADNGIEVPKTWADFIAACDKLQAAGITPMSTTIKDSWMLPIVRDVFGASAYDGPEFAKQLKSGEAKFTDARYTKANQTMLDLKKYMPKGAEGLGYTDAQTLFMTGKAAMWPGGIWDLAGFRQQAPDLDIGLFNAPRVSGSGEPFAMGYVDGSWGMSARVSADKKAAVMDYLGWLASPDYGQRLSDEQLMLSAVPGVAPKDELLKQASEMFAANPTPYLTYVNFDYGTPSGTSLEYDALQKMMLGQQGPDGVGKTLDQGISQWFKPEK